MRCSGRNSSAARRSSFPIWRGRVALRLIVANAWSAIVGPRIAAVTLVSHCEAGVLTVLAASAAGVRELETMTDRIVVKINHALLAPGAITSIRWSAAMETTAEDEQTDGPDLGTGDPDAWKGDNDAAA